MTSTRSQEIRVGIASVLAVVIIIGGIIWGKGSGLGVDNRSLKIHFANVAGLDVGAPVTLNGVRKGSVTSLDAAPEGVTVGIVVENSFALKRDARAIMMMQELTGGKKIELVPGSAPAVLAEDAELNGEVQPDIVMLLAQISAIGDDAKGTLGRVDSIMAVLSSIVGAPGFKRGITSTLANLESSSAAVRELAVGNSGNIKRIIVNLEATVNDARALVRDVGPPVQRALAAADTISGDARQALRKLQSTLLHVDSLATNVDGVVHDLREGKGVASKLIYDEAFAFRLDSTLEAVRTMIRNIDRRGVNINVGFGSKE